MGLKRELFFNVSLGTPFMLLSRDGVKFVSDAPDNT